MLETERLHPLVHSAGWPHGQAEAKSQALVLEIPCRCRGAHIWPSAFPDALAWSWIASRAARTGTHAHRARASLNFWGLHICMDFSFFAPKEIYLSSISTRHHWPLCKLSWWFIIAWLKKCLAVAEGFCLPPHSGISIGLGHLTSSWGYCTAPDCWAWTPAAAQAFNSVLFLEWRKMFLILKLNPICKLRFLSLF